MLIISHNNYDGLKYPASSSILLFHETYLKSTERFKKFSLLLFLIQQNELCREHKWILSKWRFGPNIMKSLS